VTEINVNITEAPPVQVEIEEPTGPPTIIEVPVPEVVEVQVSGPQGPVGPEGKSAYEIAVENGFSGTEAQWLASFGGDASYRHVQSTPSADVTVTHNLGKFPAISVKDSSGQAVYGSYQYIDTNTVRVLFSSAFSWEAIFN
jgi:hypothetical protein